MIEFPFITVVMPVRNESRFIADTIVQLLRQDFPAKCYEIIVVDGMSDDGTREIITEIAQQHPQVRLLDNPARGSSAGRNIGFKNGKGNIVLVVDGHCYIPDNQLLRNIVDCFERSGADCLGRPQPLDPPGLTVFQKAVALARGSRLGHGGDSLIYDEFEGFASPVSNGAAYRREVFEKVGYVDENFDACEDVEFNYRVEEAGLTCYTSPKLTVRYYPRENLQRLLQQMVRYGEGRFRFIKKHREALTINQLIPVGFVFGLVLFVVLALWSQVSSLWSLTVSHWPIVPNLLTVVYGFYALIITSESVCIAAKNGRHYLLRLLLIFFVIHFGLGWGYMLSAIRYPRAKND